MNIEDFIASFAEQFEETDPSLILESTDFKSLEEWDSLVAMGVIAFVKADYGKQISGQEIRQCKTVRELYDLVQTK